MNSFNYKDKAITSMLLDEHNDALLLCSLCDNSIHMFALGSFKKLVTFSGHLDQVHAMVYISTRNQYLSSSWDLSLRVWLIPDLSTIATLQSSTNFDVYKKKLEDKEVEHIQEPPEIMNWRDDSVPYISQYEKDHPNTMPKVLEAYIKKKKSGIIDRLLINQDHDLNISPLRQSRPTNQHGASLFTKINSLEAILKP
ncbi:hypothetical protein KC19_VG003100, partial [Ceratodon purpureus]